MPLQTAILSYGLSGKVFHAPFVSSTPGLSLYGIWERSTKKAALDYPGIKSFDTLEVLLSDSNIDLVIVNTPNKTHYEYAKSCLEAGKHVIVEKPFTVTADEAHNLVHLAAAKNRMLSVYQNRRYDSDFRTVKKVVNEGLLGEIVEAEFHFDRFRSELSAKAHKEIPGGGAGILYDLGAHIIDQALHLFGRPEALYADIRMLRPQSRVDDYFEILLFYPSLRVRLHASYYVAEQGPGYILHGRNGSFIKSRGDVQETKLAAGMKPGGNDWGIEEEGSLSRIHSRAGENVVRASYPIERGDYADYFREIVAAIEGRGANPVPGEEGSDVIRVIEAAFLSEKEGKKIRLDW